MQWDVLLLSSNTNDSSLQFERFLFHMIWSNFRRVSDWSNQAIPITMKCKREVNSSREIILINDVLVRLSINLGWFCYGLNSKLNWLFTSNLLVNCSTTSTPWWVKLENLSPFHLRSISVTWRGFFNLLYLIFRMVSFF